jgi:hypothetical protein
MNAEAARTLLRAWSNSHPDPDVAAGSQRVLLAELIALVPQDAVAVAATEDREQNVLAVSRSGVLVLEQTAISGFAQTTGWRFGWAWRSTDGSRRQITLVEAISEQAHNILRRREWTFRFDSNPLMLIGEEIVRGANFAGEQSPDHNELGARELARTIGWTLPTPDESLAEYPLEPRRSLGGE